MDIQATLSEQRTNVRVSIPAIATLDNSDYRVENWSLGGLQLSDFKQTVKVGDCLPIQLRWQIDGGAHIEMNTLIEVVWTTPFKRHLGAHFLNLTQFETQLLQHSIENCQSSEMTGLEPSIHRHEILPQALPPDTRSPQFQRSIRQKFHLNRPVAVLAYIGVGGIIVGLGVSAMAQAINTMEIRSAVVAGQFEPIVVSGTGVLGAVYIQPGMAVQVGQRLFQVSQSDAIDREMGDINALARNKIDNVDRVTQQIALSQIELAEAQAGLRHVESLKQQELFRLESYTTIAHSKVNTDRSRVQSLTVQHRMAKNNLDRVATLLRQGAISQQVFDATNAQFAILEGDLSAAQEQLKIAQTANGAVRNGNFYDGNHLVGELPRLASEIKDWQRRIQLASQKVTTLQQVLSQQAQEVQRLDRQKQSLQQLLTHGGTADPNPLSVVYRSPFSGFVIKVMKSKGNTVGQSETVAILQQDSKQITVSAYLSQDQADYVKIGAQATVSVPILSKTYQAQVVEIDRTGGFEEPVRGKYQFGGSNAQSAFVKLSLVNINPTDQRQLNAGTPVILRFVKKANILKVFFNRSTVF
jgi:HlyD family secretion protein